MKHEIEKKWYETPEVEMVDMVPLEEIGNEDSTREAGSWGPWV